MGRPILSGIMALLGAAMILLAFSEYIFANEGPVEAIIHAPGPRALALAVMEAVGLYLLSAVVLVALERQMSSWTRILLVGAFVGWSIESALVPVAYEAPPFSYLWTSVSWHAVIDVAFGYVAYRLLLRRGPVSAMAVTVVVGVLWAVWSTWVWDALKITLEQFALVAGVVAALLCLGLWLADKGLVMGGPPRRRAWIWGALAVNAVFWGFNAIPFAVAAGGLLVTALVTAFALYRAPSGTGLIVTPQMMPRWRYMLPFGSAGIATATYGIILETGPPVPTSELVWPVFAFGALWFFWALYVGLRGRRK